MKDEHWVEDENHQTINGERWVAKKCDGWCSQPRFPVCEMSQRTECQRFGKYHCGSGQRKDGCEVRWYRADSPALAFFDGLKEEQKPVTDPVRPLSEICMDGIRSSLKTLIQDRDRQAVEALRDSRAASLDTRVQAAMDAMLTVPDGLEEPPGRPCSPRWARTTPEDDVEIIIDPTPEQVPEGGAWGCWWDENHSIRDDLIGMVPKHPYGCHGWAHFAILVHGHLTPSELVTRVRKMITDKESE